MSEETRYFCDICKIEAASDAILWAVTLNRPKDHYPCRRLDVCIRCIANVFPEDAEAIHKGFVSGQTGTRRIKP